MTVTDNVNDTYRACCTITFISAAQQTNAAWLVNCTQRYSKLKITWFIQQLQKTNPTTYVFIFID